MKITFDTDNYSFGKKLDLTFEYDNGSNAAYNLTAQTPVIPVNENGYAVVVYVYPTVNGTFTLQEPAPVVSVID